MLFDARLTQRLETLISFWVTSSKREKRKERRHIKNDHDLCKLILIWATLNGCKNNIFKSKSWRKGIRRKQFIGCTNHSSKFPLIRQFRSSRPMLTEPKFTVKTDFGSSQYKKLKSRYDYLGNLRAREEKQNDQEEKQAGKVGDVFFLLYFTMVSWTKCYIFQYVSKNNVFHIISMICILVKEIF